LTYDVAPGETAPDAVPGLDVYSTPAVFDDWFDVDVLDRVVETAARCRVSVQVREYRVEVTPETVTIYDRERSGSGRNDPLRPASGR